MTKIPAREKVEFCFGDKQWKKLHEIHSMLDKSKCYGKKIKADKGIWTIRGGIGNILDTWQEKISLTSYKVRTVTIRIPGEREHSRQRQWYVQRSWDGACLLWEKVKFFFSTQIHDFLDSQWYCFIPWRG